MIRFTGRMTLAAAVISLVALGACANSAVHANSGEFASSSESPGEVLAPPINWSNPIDGDEVASLEAAQPSLGFTVYDPKGLGTRRSVFVSPSGTEKELAVVALLYETPGYGLVVVKQHLPDVPIADYDKANQELMEMNGLPTVHGSFDLVAIREGQEALVTTSEDGTTSSIFWLEKNIEIVVRGPDLDKTDVLKIAEGL
ncbi:MAG: hypothetical protein ABI635_02940 [Actinomycetota bacterium]